MQRPFEGIRIIDITHVLAGPFAAYQLGLMGADVIKVEHPDDPDQSRDSGSDNDLNHANMGTGFLTQGSNKRAITLNLKTEQGREILKKLVATADVLVENYRPGAFEALGLGYEDLKKINPKLIYASFSAFGQGGPRREQTAYDHLIQSTSGIMAMTGTPNTNPIKIGAPAIDYATGTMGAYALSAALFQRERTGLGQRIVSDACCAQEQCVPPRGERRRRLRGARGARSHRGRPWVAVRPSRRSAARLAGAPAAGAASDRLELR